MESLSVYAEDIWKFLVMIISFISFLLAIISFTYDSRQKTIFPISISILGIFALVTYVVGGLFPFMFNGSVNHGALCDLALRPECNNLWGGEWLQDHFYPHTFKLKLFMSLLFALHSALPLLSFYFTCYSFKLIFWSWEQQKNTIHHV